MDPKTQKTTSSAAAYTPVSFMLEKAQAGEAFSEAAQSNDSIQKVAKNLDLVTLDALNTLE